MRRSPAPVALLLVLLAYSAAVPEVAPPVTAAAARIEPPVAARRTVRLTTHGIERTDDYAWLRADNWREVIRDPSLLPAEIRAYLEAENNYARTLQAPLAPLRAKLVAEMKGRIPPAESGVPMPDGPYAYWAKYVPGAEHVQIVRSPRDGGPEEILLDGNELAKGKAYFSFGGSRRQSPDHKFYGYTIDETGAETNTLLVRDLASKRDLPDTITNVSDFAWADSQTLFYSRLDDEHRPLFVYRHRLGTDPANDPLVYEEKDLQFAVSVGRTNNGRFVVISTSSSDTSESRLIEVAHPDGAPVLVQARTDNLLYDVDDWGDQLVIRTNADGAEDFKVVTAPVSAPGRQNWRDLIPYQQGRRILSVDPLENYLVRLERENGLGRLVIRRKSDGSEHSVAFEGEAYSISFIAPFEYNTQTIRFSYSSPAVPSQTYDYDVETHERVLRKQQEIPSGHDPSAYVVRRLFATTADHEQVPITLLYRKGTKLDGSAPLFLEGYGAYALPLPASFSGNILSLVDRGFVYGLAHVRGGIEKGERWRNTGRRENKMNTFTDFIAVAEYLIQSGYTSRGRIVARGDSAGGLLMGVVANMRPDLFAGIIARVPFVDALNTMLDEDLPLTASDFPEWGDPIRDIAAYRTIASYAPYENVKAQAYPSMLVTAGISDPRVQYWEPAKWVAKLRAMNTNNARIELVTVMRAGHFGASGRFVELDEVALLEAFAIDVAGARRPGDP
jgi:oligopeptidase B